MNCSSLLLSGSLRRADIWPRCFGVLLLLAAAMVGGGCATSYRFTIDAVRHPDATSGRAAYVLVNHTPPGSVGELAFAPAARDVRTALTSRGCFEAPAGVAPEFEVEIDFGLEGPVQRKLTHTEPVYVSAPSVPRAMGGRGTDDRGVHAPPRKIGERTVTSVILEYRKFLRLTARAARSGNGDQPRSVLWSVLVSNDDESDDLARYVRLMAAAAMDAIDQDTGAASKVVLTDGDGRVVFIEQGL